MNISTVLILKLYHFKPLQFRVKGIKCDLYALFLSSEQILELTWTLEYCVFFVFVYTKCVILCLAGDNCLHISTCTIDDNYEFMRVKLFEALMKTAQCVTVRGPLLAIGCKGGKHV